MSKGTLYTSYFSKMKQGKGIKISIARFNPKWLNEEHIDEWFRDLAPRSNLLNDYKNGSCDWDEYTSRYNDEMKGENSFIQIDKIRELLDNGNDVTIYCYEKPTDNCHRHLLGRIFKELGFEVKEIE